MAKVKASDKLSFPLKLDLAPLLAMDSAKQPHEKRQQETNYELMSILIHKGSSASHGHYGMLFCLPPELLRRCRFWCANCFQSAGKTSLRTDAVLQFSVAHVWDEEAKKWWRFDDETVAEMPKGPVGERSDHGVAAEKKVRFSRD